MKVFLVAGARPNFMKIAPLYREAKKYEKIQCKIIHTEQHYDYEMSEAFFKDLEIPKPDYSLNSGSGSHAVQTAKIMVSFEGVCLKERPELVIVVGDVNSTLACSIVAKKLLIQVAHVEAGLRSFDMSMPEEINRIVTDSISDYLFVTEESGIKNLLNEGRKPEAIHFVGHVMIDNLFFQLERIKESDFINRDILELKSKVKDYVFLTLHRPSNVDIKEKFEEIVDVLNLISNERPIVFPIHPRTRKMISQFDIHFSENILCLPPLSFKESLFLWKDALLVMTDSGGLQEETTALGIPCVTIRENTERPVTLEMGTNILGGTGRDSILEAYKKAIQRIGEPRKIPPKWDGKASERIWKILTS